MGSEVKVSIIVPIYNAENYITTLIPQLVSQTLKEIEIILVDDGSTDKTYELLQEFLKIDKRISYIYQKNSGAGCARNMGIDHCSGEYFICLDADDIYDENLVKVLYEAASADSVDIAMCAFNRENHWTNTVEKDLGYVKEWLPDQKVFTAEDLKEPFRTFTHGPMNKLYRTNFIMQSNLRYSSTRIANDVFFALATVTQASKIVFDKRSLLTIRRHINASSISSNRGMFLPNCVQVYRELYQFLDNAENGKKFIPYIYISFSVSFLYNSQYAKSETFVEELSNWLCEEPWISWSKANLEKTFCINKIDAQERLLISYKKKLTSAREDEKSSINTQIAFAENKIANLKMLSEKINAVKGTNKTETLKYKEFVTREPNANVIRKSIKYLKEHGFKIFCTRVYTEVCHMLRLSKVKIKIKSAFWSFCPATKKDTRRFLLNRTRNLFIEQKEHFEELFSKQESTTNELLNSTSRIESAFMDHNRAVSQDLEFYKKAYLALEEKYNLLSYDLQKAISFHDENSINLEQYDFLKRSLQEITWAAVWNSTITGSTWLNNKGFSPGRFAVGYQYLYILYRVLDEIKPKSILEFGLGQSSKMIFQYISHNCDVYFTCVEQSDSWIQFFCKNYPDADTSHILQLDTVEEKFKGNVVRAYASVKERLCDKRFSLICIDGPTSGDMTGYARIDILKLLPECLEDSFVIFLDDCQRAPEIHTRNLILKKLDEAQVSYSKRTYSGKVDTSVICSKDLEFICSL